MVKLSEINQDISIGILDLEAFAQAVKIQKKRESEVAGTRFLIAQLLKESNYDLCYTQANKPFLNNRSEHISISHSHDKLAIIVNRKEDTGIDIELIRDKVQLITHKFLNAAERLFAGNNIETLITLWAAKEAMYKVYGLKGVDFRRSLFVDEFDTDEITGKIVMNGIEKHYLLKKEKIENYIMVYVKHEI